MYVVVVVVVVVVVICDKVKACLVTVKLVWFLMVTCLWSHFIVVTG